MIFEDFFIANMYNSPVMKPKNLKCPFPWEKRKVILADRVWFVPGCLDNYSDFSFPGWESPQFFGNANPIYVEYCSGNGAWIAEKAKAHPDVNWVAVEIQFERVRKIWSKIKNLELDNLIVVCGAAECVTSHYFPPSSIQKAFINFPDPWPKRRHAKHRIIKTDFIADIGRSLKEGGEVTLVTDDPDYSQEMQKTLSRAPNFHPIHPAPYYVTHIEGYGSSFFDELWRAKGKTIHYHQSKKV